MPRTTDKNMRKIEVFEQEGIFTIRHFRPDTGVFDQTFSDEIIFLEALGSYLYLSEHKVDVKCEVGIAPIVVGFLEAVVSTQYVSKY